ncbi:MAG: ribbon-helix-helix protein, CopG family [Proteobacteria bacterium]|nr:ribbon-helix-helix protein, CopG family [Pseudomonadota bacterium]
MGRTLRTQVALYLDDIHIELLDRLARKSGRTKQDLLREAVNTLLLEYQMIKRPLRRRFDAGG